MIGLAGFMQAPKQEQEQGRRGFWDVYQPGRKAIYCTVFNSLEAESYREIGFTVVEQDGLPSGIKKDTHDHP